MSEVFTNLAYSTISGSLGSTATTVTVASGQGSRFPDPGGGDFFRVVMVKLSTGEYEIAQVDTRTGDVLNFGSVGNRGIEGTTALTFNDGDIIECRPTAGFFSSLLTDREMQENAPSYAFDTGTPNAYTISLTPAWTGAYVEGMRVVFQASNANTGLSTLSINGGAAVAIAKDRTFGLVADDIESGDIVDVVYDGSVWQLLSINNKKAALYLREGSAPPAQANAIALWSQEVNARSALFARSEGGSGNYQFPFPYGTILMAEWTVAPTAWQFKADSDDRVPIIESTIAEVDDEGGSWTISGISVDGATLDWTQLPAGNIVTGLNITGDNMQDGNDNFRNYVNGGTNQPTGGLPHGHNLTIGSAWRPAYRKVGRFEYVG